MILRTLAALSLALASLSTSAADDLGMRISGDDSANFGLTISNWVEGQDAGTLAPGLIREDAVALDEWQLRMQIRMERAVSPPGAPINQTR